MKTVLSYGVLLAYLATWLSWMPDEKGPVVLWLPLLALANFGNIRRGGPIIPGVIVAVIGGIIGCISILLSIGGFWKSKWGTIVACVALLISECAFVAGTYQRTLSAMTATPFLILSLILLVLEICSFRKFEDTL
jgi:uncharacterized membrane protein